MKTVGKLSWKKGSAYFDSLHAKIGTCWASVERKDPLALHKGKVAWEVRSDLPRGEMEDHGLAKTVSAAKSAAKKAMTVCLRTHHYLE